MSQKMQNCKILDFFHQISYSLLIVSSRIMMETNPWQVDSIELFLFFNCPECTFLTKEEKYFAYHAAINHPLSSSFFAKQMEQEQSKISSKISINSPDLDEGSIKNHDLVLDSSPANFRKIANCSRNEEKINSKRDSFTDTAIEISEQSASTTEDPLVCSNENLPLNHHSIDGSGKVCQQLEQEQLEINPIIIDYSPDLDEASINNLDAALETSPTKVMDENFEEFGTSFENDGELFDSQIVNVIFSKPGTQIAQLKNLNDGKILTENFFANESQPVIIEGVKESPQKLETNLDHVSDFNTTKIDHLDEIEQSVSEETKICPACSFVTKNLDHHINVCHQPVLKLKVIRDNYYNCSNFEKRDQEEFGYNRSKRYMCSLCEKLFVKAVDLEKHTKKAHDDKKPYKTHEVHEEKKPIKCTICKKVLLDKAGLLKHISMVHKVKIPFKCSICDERLDDKSSLQKHLNSVHNSKKNLYCNICDLSFLLKRSMTKHFASVHNEKIKLFDCSICRKSFMSIVNLNQHISYTHEGEKPEIKSRTHPIETVHDKKKPNNCTQEVVNGKKKVKHPREALIDKKMELVKTQSSKHASREVSLMSNIDHGRLRQRIRKEAVTFPLKDGECKSFEIQKSISKDILFQFLKFDNDKKKNKFKCSICDFTAHDNNNSRGYILMHIKSIHKNEIIASSNSMIDDRYDCGNSECKALYGVQEGKKFWCTICTKLDLLPRQNKPKSEIKGKKTEKPTNKELCTVCRVSIMNLKQHLDNVHNPEKQICHKCDQELKNLHSLKEHINTEHTKESCTICGKMYIAKRMKNHIHSVHTPNDQK